MRPYCILTPLRSTRKQASNAMRADRALESHGCLAYEQPLSTDQLDVLTQNLLITLFSALWSCSLEAQRLGAALLQKHMLDREYSNGIATMLLSAQELRGVSQCWGGSSIQQPGVWLRCSAGASATVHRALRQRTGSVVRPARSCALFASSSHILCKDHQTFSFGEVSA
jgi:hypothetical protein